MKIIAKREKGGRNVRGEKRKRIKVDSFITSNFGRVGEVYDVVRGTVEPLQRRVVDEGP